MHQSIASQYRNHVNNVSLSSTSPSTPGYRPRPCPVLRRPGPILYRWWRPLLIRLLMTRRRGWHSRRGSVIPTALLLRRRIHSRTLPATVHPLIHPPIGCVSLRRVHPAPAHPATGLGDYRLETFVLLHFPVTDGANPDIGGMHWEDGNAASVVRNEIRAEKEGTSDLVSGFIWRMRHDGLSETHVQGEHHFVLCRDNRHW